MNELPTFAVLDRKVSRRKFLKHTGKMALAAAAMGAGGWTYATKIEPEWWEVVPVTVALPRLDAAFDGFRLVQFSDIHLSEAMTPGELAEVCRSVIALQPDLVAITGDFVDDRASLLRWGELMSKILKQVADFSPAVAVLGNHDYRMGVSSIRTILTSAGVRLLKNEVTAIERGDARLFIGGVDDVWRGRPDLKKIAAEIPTGAPAILLAHEPDYAVNTAQTRRFGLQLSGHSHGGQVNLPLVGPPILPRLGKRYPAGLYQVGPLQQYTNRGLGTTTPHVRFNCRPEITLITLRQSGSREG